MSVFTTEIVIGTFKIFFALEISWMTAFTVNASYTVSKTHLKVFLQINSSKNLRRGNEARL